MQLQTDFDPIVLCLVVCAWKSSLEVKAASTSILESLSPNWILNQESVRNKRFSMKQVDQLLVYTKVVDVFQRWRLLFRTGSSIPKIITNCMVIFEIQTEVQQGIEISCSIYQASRSAELADTRFWIGFRKNSRPTDFKHIFTDFT